MTAATTEPILQAHTKALSRDTALGILTLNRPKALNSLNLELIAALRQQLQAWQQDPTIGAIWLQGNDKALCAGGDVREVQQHSVAAPSAAAALVQASQFFEAEYGLYAYMASYPKPIVSWCSGIVMGGGLGLAAASTLRIVTETTMMAMPEISIGLFPDAGANWFLQRFPMNSGVFLGLTGARFNAADAMLGNLAEYALPAMSREATIQSVCQSPWHPQHSITEHLAHTLSTLPSVTLAPSNILQHQAAIERVVSQATFQDALAQLATLPQPSAWLQSAQDFVQQGCATSAGLHWWMMQRCRRLSLDEVLALEHSVASRCAISPDFIEGVRALLVDKDKQPKWQKSLANVDAAWLASFFEPLPSH